MKIRIFTLLFPALLCGLISQVTAQAPKSGSGSSERKAYPDFNLFGDENMLKISLKFDMSTYVKAKPKEEWLKAEITIHISNTDSVTRDIRLRTRGEFRNANCYFAPIELNLKKADFGYKDLNKISKIKLVPQCNPGNEGGNYVLREYIIYKLYNVLTDDSFRARLLTINYIDSEKKKKTITQYGFLIEPVEMLAERTGSVEIKSAAVNQKNVIPPEMDRVAIFNYMIGNYDWAVPNQHNIKLFKAIKVDTLQLATAVPYDFDWTGMVNAAYAIPAENVGTTNVRERIFLGICRPRDVFRNDLQQFLEKKDALYRVINEFPWLNQRAKRDMTVYLDGFFEQCTGRQEILDVFLRSCKKF